MSNYSDLFDLIGELARKRYQVGERCFATLGFNHSEARLLTLLDKQGGKCSQDILSGMLSIDRSNAGRALKGLESAGYVERATADEDRRTKAVVMTAKGRQLVKKIQGLRKGMAEGFFGELTEDEAGVIVKMLKGSADPSSGASTLTAADLEVS